MFSPQVEASVALLKEQIEELLFTCVEDEPASAGGIVWKTFPGYWPWSQENRVIFEMEIDPDYRPQNSNFTS